MSGRRAARRGFISPLPPDPPQLPPDTSNQPLPRTLRRQKSSCNLRLASLHSLSAPTLLPSNLAAFPAHPQPQLDAGARGATASDKHRVRSNTNPTNLPTAFSSPQLSQPRAQSSVSPQQPCEVRPAAPQRGLKRDARTERILQPPLQQHNPLTSCKFSAELEPPSASENPHWSLRRIFPLPPSYTRFISIAAKTRPQRVSSQQPKQYRLRGALFDFINPEEPICFNEMKDCPDQVHSSSDSEDLDSRGMASDCSAPHRGHQGAPRKILHEDLPTAHKAIASSISSKHSAPSQPATPRSLSFTERVSTRTPTRVPPSDKDYEASEWSTIYSSGSKSASQAAKGSIPHSNTWSTFGEIISLYDHSHHSLVNFPGGHTPRELKLSERSLLAPSSEREVRREVSTSTPEGHTSILDYTPATVEHGRGNKQSSLVHGRTSSLEPSSSSSMLSRYDLSNFPPNRGVELPSQRVFRDSESSLTNRLSLSSCAGIIVGLMTEDDIGQRRMDLESGSLTDDSTDSAPLANAWYDTFDDEGDNENCAPILRTPTGRDQAVNLNVRGRASPQSSGFESTNSQSEQALVDGVSINTEGSINDSDLDWEDVSNCRTETDGSLVPNTRQMSPEYEERMFLREYGNSGPGLYPLRLPSMTHSNRSAVFGSEPSGGAILERNGKSCSSPPPRSPLPPLPFRQHVQASDDAGSKTRESMADTSLPRELSSLGEIPEFRSFFRGPQLSIVHEHPYESDFADRKSAGPRKKSRGSMSLDVDADCDARRTVSIMDEPFRFGPSIGSPFRPTPGSSEEEQINAFPTPPNDMAQVRIPIFRRRQPVARRDSSSMYLSRSFTDVSKMLACQDLSAYLHDAIGETVDGSAQTMRNESSDTLETADLHWTHNRAPPEQIRYNRDRSLLIDPVPLARDSSSSVYSEIDLPLPPTFTHMAQAFPAPERLISQRPTRAGPFTIGLTSPIRAPRRAKELRRSRRPVHPAVLGPSRFDNAVPVPLRVALRCERQLKELPRRLHPVNLPMPVGQTANRAFPNLWHQSQNHAELESRRRRAKKMSLRMMIFTLLFPPFSLLYGHGALDGSAAYLTDNYLPSFQRHHKNLALIIGWPLNLALFSGILVFLEYMAKKVNH